MSSEKRIDKNPFQDRMESLDDKALFNVVKKGVDYEQQAVEAAVIVAAKRNLITQAEAEKLFKYTIESSDLNNEIRTEKIKEIKSTAKVEIAVGLFISAIGLGVAFFSDNNFWIPTLIFGSILIVRGFFNK